MKQINIFIVLAFLLFCISGFSQDTEDAIDNPVPKGTIFLSGQSSLRAGLNNIDDSSFNVSSYSFSPTAGYFLIDNLVAGAEVTFSGFKTTRSNQVIDLDLDFISSSEVESKGRSVVLAPFVRYYFNTGRIKPYVSTSVGFGFNSARNESTMTVNGDSNTIESESKGRSTRYTLAGGTAIFLTKYVSIDTGIQYDTSTFNTDLDSGDSSDRKDSNINFIGGISIYL
jgi:opacity protein-like surface antigen